MSESDFARISAASVPSSAVRSSSVRDSIVEIVSSSSASRWSLRLFSVE